MRWLGLIAVSILLVAAVGAALCKVAGWNIGLSGLVVAAIASAAASGLAFVPVVLTRGASQLAQAQAALVGTLVHLFVALLAAGAVLLGKPPVAASFVYWMLAFYWVTLTVLVVSFTRGVRMSDVPTATPAGAAPANKS